MPATPMENDDGSGSNELIQYQTDEGAEVVFPSWKSRQVKRAGLVTHDREVRIRDSRFDEDFEENMFSFQSLGVENGDQLNDHVNNTTLVFLEGKPVEPDVFMAKVHADSLKRGSRTTVLLLVNGFILLFVVAFYLLRRHRS